jgi:pimeloyl-ACP methyl ester carboxylesterase
MPKVRVNGSGEPLVLVMGFGGDHLAWAFQFRAFAARYRVVTFDNRGVGQTDAPERTYTTREMADDTAALMDAPASSRRT